MKKLFILGLIIMLSFGLAGCNEKESIKFSFDLSNVENVEIFRFTNPADAKKKVITESKDIESIYQTFESISLKDKTTEPTAGGSVTSFRFNLYDGTTYEIVYSEIAVRSGLIMTTDMEQSLCTSADIGANWENFNYEVITASEDELPVLPKIENISQDLAELQWDKIPMVMVNGMLYYDTGKESTKEPRCGMIDEKITSSVDGTETPTKDDQSNFGMGFEYQYGADDTLEIFMNDKWIIFERRSEQTSSSTTVIKDEKSWTTQDIDNMFIQVKKDDWQYIDSVLVSDLDSDLIGAVLFWDAFDETSSVAFFDANGYYQQCGLYAKLSENPNFKYLGDGRVTYMLEDDEGITYNCIITISIHDGNVQFKVEDDYLK